MSWFIFGISFVYLYVHVGYFGFGEGITSATQVIAVGIHALLLSLGFLTLTIERKKG